MTIRIGINPLTWTNDDMPELGAETPLDVCLSEAKQAGYEGIELGNKFPRRAAELKPIMQQHELDIVSGWYGSQLLERGAKDETALMQDHLTLLKEMGCKVMVFADVSHAIHGDISLPLSQRPVMTDEQWEELTTRLSRMGAYLASQGVRMAYHHHMGTVIQSEEDIDRLMQSTTPDVGLLLDTGHLTFAGGDPMAVAARYIDRINHVHCKDIREDIMAKALEKDWPFLKSVLKGVFTVPGDGMIAYEPLIRLLQQSDYNGWLIVEAEQDPAKAHPLTYAQKGFEHLRKQAA